MANLGKKDGIFHIRFRYGGKEYKKSLKTHDEGAAEAARHVVELTLHRLLTGQGTVPDGVDPGAFIVSGGTLRTPPATPVKRSALPSTRQAAVTYGEMHKALMAPSYHYSQNMHLRHLMRHLGDRADLPCDRITHQDLDGYVKKRLSERHANTAERERITLLQFYKWLVAQGHLSSSPAAGLKHIKGGEDRPPFRTHEEINRLIQRGGLAEEEALDLWECLYLGLPEIGALLAAVRANAKVDYSYLLHAIPAYTGMRRGEILRLRWVDVDLDEDYVYARSRKQSRRKSETSRRIDLHSELKQELLAWRKERPRGQFVVCEKDTLEPVKKDRANRCFWQPMRGTNWCLDTSKDWFKIGFHSYRHSFASNLPAAGVDQRIIDEWMGHQTEAMRRRYRHLFPKDRKSAIRAISLAAATQ